MLDLLKRFGFIPRQAVWELTLSCDMRCRHCGSRAGRERADELTTAEALKLAKELAAAGCKRLTLSGGEPLMRKDWPLICQTLVSNGVRVNMISNGRKFSAKVAKRAKAFGLEGISFSLDGLQETHEYIRRVKGHWQKVIDNFDIAREAGLPAGAVTLVVRQTIDELDEIREILREHDVRTWQLQLGNPTGNMADNPGMVVYPEDVLRIIPKAAELRKMPGYPKVYIGDNLGYFGDYEQDLRDQDGLIPFWIGCRAGCSVVGIESNGNIKGCLSLPSAMNNVDVWVEGNIRDRSFKDIWNDPNAFAYNRQFKVDNLVGFCRTCEYAEVCRGGCAWTAFAHTGHRYEFLHCYHRVKSLMDQGKLVPHEELDTLKKEKKVKDKIKKEKVAARKAAAKKDKVEKKAKADKKDKDAKKPAKKPAKKTAKKAEKKSAKKPAKKPAKVGAKIPSKKSKKTKGKSARA